MNEPQHFPEMEGALETLKRAGWISLYTMTDPPDIIWTAHGRERAKLLLSLADELDCGAHDWVYYEAVCRFLASDKFPEGLN